jgi:hypothetical protein
MFEEEKLFHYHFQIFQGELIRGVNSVFDSSSLIEFGLTLQNFVLIFLIFPLKFRSFFFKILAFSIVSFFKEALQFEKIMYSYLQTSHLNAFEFLFFLSQDYIPSFI